MGYEKSVRDIPRDEYWDKYFMGNALCITKPTVLKQWRQVFLCKLSVDRS